MAAQMLDPGLSRFRRDIQKFPILTEEEESRLARQWRQEGNIGASHKLVTSHLRLVVKIAAGYTGYGLPLSDIVSAGQIGMMQAISRFDLDRGVRLATYAQWWIRAAVQDFILRSWSLVRIGTTPAQKKLFFNLRALKAKIRIVEEGDLSPSQVAEIATTLEVSEAEVVNMNRRLTGFDHSLNARRGEQEIAEWQDQLIDESANQEAAFAEREESDQRRAVLTDILAILTPRERRIVTARHLSERPTTLRELTVEYGISRERVRQIEVKALEKLQRAAATYPRRGNPMMVDAPDSGSASAAHAVAGEFSLHGASAASRIRRISVGGFGE